VDPSEHAATVAERYSTNAEAYLRHWAPVLGGSGSRLLDFAGIAGSGRFLDLGTGVGTLLPKLAERAPSATVIGADRAEGMIRLAPKSFPIVVLDASALSFRDAVFSGVVMAFMLFHVPEPEAALAEVRRVLQPGGVLALATWVAGGDDWIADAVWTEELDARGADPAEPGPSRHELMDSPAKVIELLESAGFGEVETELSPIIDAVDVNEFLERRTGMGLAATRFRSLAPNAQQGCLDQVRSRLDGLSDEEMTSQDAAILTRATRT